MALTLLPGAVTLWACSPFQNTSIIARNVRNELELYFPILDRLISLFCYFSFFLLPRFNINYLLAGYTFVRNMHMWVLVTIFYWWEQIPWYIKAESRWIDNLIISHVWFSKEKKITQGLFWYQAYRVNSFSILDYPGHWERHFYTNLQQCRQG